jgi:nitrite reductase/ring-hydroxylating ferredoxin subunit
VKVVVANIKDFPDGDRKIVDVGGKSVGVFRFGDTFYAIRNRCPHQFGPLCLGTVEKKPFSSGPGDFHMAVDGPPFIRCPWHGWEYDLSSGQSFLGPGGYIPEARMYNVDVKPGADVAEVVPDPKPGHQPEEERADGRVKGPYVAETVSVYLEDDYVVIED